MAGPRGRRVLLLPLLACVHGLHTATTRPLRARWTTGRTHLSCCAAPPERQVDERGFVVPQVGDVVKVPSKWPGEWDVAQVDFVQTISSRGAVEVDLLPLKPIGSDMYRLPGRKPATMRADIAKLGKVDAEYVRSSDAYRIPPEQLEPLVARKPEDPDVTAANLAAYAALKAELLREAAIVGGAGAALAYALIGADAAVAFATGSLAGCAYLYLLGSEADAVGSAEGQPKAVVIAKNGRLLLPAVLMAALAAKQSVSGFDVRPFAALPKEVFGSAALGFLSYKAPLLVRQVIRAFQELGEEAAQAPLGAGALPTGSLGFAVSAVKQRQKAKREKAEAEASAQPETARQIVIAGPSGVGKSTLVAKLLEEEPGLFDFSVSTTTRTPRPDEEDGVSYRFVSREEFDEMIARGDFLEWAEIGGERYGTSAEAVRCVSDSGKLCVLDVDTQGVETICSRPDLKPLCIWVAPPDFDALRKRLKDRGEEMAEIDRRVARARGEIEFALTTNYFDKTIVNENLEAAYTELRQYIRSATQR